MISLEKYPLLEYNEKKGCLQLKGTKVTLPAFVHSIRSGVSKEKLLNYAELTEAQFNEILRFLKDEIGLEIGDLRT